MKIPIRRWTFPSSSNPDKSYETLQYDDGSLSCDCLGWCRRAVRTCKHVRAVQCGEAGRGMELGVVAPAHSACAELVLATDAPRRRFDLEE